MIRPIIKTLAALVLLLFLLVTGYCLSKYYQAEKLYSQLTLPPEIIKVQEFNNLNKTLQTIAVQSLYYGLRLSLKKQPRNENIYNFVEVVLGLNHKFGVKKSVFGGKIGFFGKKLCLNLT